MNKFRLVALMDDWHMSARLAKLSTFHSYNLEFIESIFNLSNEGKKVLLIIDMDILKLEEPLSVVKFKNGKSIFVLGYARKLDTSKMTFFNNYGYDMVLNRNKLLKNIESVVRKITSAN